MNRIEEEVVVLRAMVDLVGSAVNKSILKVTGTTPDNEIRFNSTADQKLFAIILVDLLSVIDKDSPAAPRKPFLRALRDALETPSFDVGGSAAALRATLTDFDGWLNTKADVNVWLPTINANTTLSLPRYVLIKIAGTLSKHNFLRAVGVGHELQGLLAQSKHVISIGQALLVQEDVYQWFHDDVLEYHSSTIAEFLNNIRWGIQTYLVPEYARSFTKENPADPDDIRYHFLHPAGVDDPFARSCYWDLMNSMRARPYVEPFTVTKHLKGRY